MNYRFKKEAHLKSRKTIRLLFEDGKQLKKFPLKLMFSPSLFSEDVKQQVAFSVPKRNFKRAVDRNHLKRLLRESYRLQQHNIKETKTQYALMFIYIGKEKITFEALQDKMEQLLLKFNIEINLYEKENI